MIAAVPALTEFLNEHSTALYLLLAGLALIWFTIRAEGEDDA